MKNKNAGMNLKNIGGVYKDAATCTKYADLNFKDGEPDFAKSTTTFTLHRRAALLTHGRLGLICCWAHGEEGFAAPGSKGQTGEKTAAKQRAFSKRHQHTLEPGLWP